MMNVCRICLCSWWMDLLGIKNDNKTSKGNNNNNNNEELIESESDSHQNHVTGITSRNVSPSPSNYCRISTCESFHIHELTPKCLETFAPSSTCSSCQNCDKTHYGPRHSQSSGFNTNDYPNSLNGNNIDDDDDDEEMPYNPQHSPEHTYRFDFNTM